jgi:hypothetical protein
VSRSRFWEPSASDNALFTGVRGIEILGSSPWIFSFVTVAVTLGRR